MIPPLSINDNFDDQIIISNFELLQNYPNPFNPLTTIPYHLKETVQVRLAIYNMLGQRVRILVNRIQEAGVIFKV